MLGNWLWVSLFDQGAWTKWPPETPYSFNQSVILCFYDDELFWKFIAMNDIAKFSTQLDPNQHEIKVSVMVFKKNVKH